MSTVPLAKKFSFSNQKSDQINGDPNDIHVPLIHMPDKENRVSDGRPSSIKSIKEGTPGFPTPIWRGLSSEVSKEREPKSRELDSLSQNMQKFTSKLDSMSMPDRIQLVKRTRIGRRGQVKLGFDINSMDQSLELDGSLFNHDEFSIDFGGLDLLEFSFKKAEGIRLKGKKSSKSDITVDHEALEKFNYKNFAIALNVEGDLRRIGYISKLNGVYYINDLEEKVLYKIQKIEPFASGCQKVFILNEKEDVVGGLDLIYLGTNTLACTVMFPPEINNIDKLLIVGSVFVLMWKITPSKQWMNQLNPSRSSYIYQLFKKIFNKLCPRH